MLSTKMRIYHRYLGFFLAGIMAVYAISGMLMIFRDTDFLKKEKHLSKDLKPQLAEQELGQKTNIRNLKITRQSGDTAFFEQGYYLSSTGHAEYTVKELPYVLNKLTKIHKAKSSDKLFFLNLFFGLSLLFFVVSSFWMFMPRTAIFRKGIYFALAGLALTLLLLFL